MKFLALTLFMLSYVYLFGGDNIFCADAAHDETFKVDLLAGKNYEVWVLDMNGPESVDISIIDGSYVAYAATFRLMHPEGDYLPYHPGFTVEESGSYEVVVHPLDPGTIRLSIRQDTGINPGRIMRDIQAIH